VEKQNLLFSWLLRPASGISMGWIHCSGYFSLIMNFNPEDGGSMASETLVSNLQTTRRSNLEDHDLKLLKCWHIVTGHLYF